MKILKSTLLAALVALGFTNAASALSFSDTDGSPTWLSNGSSVNGTLTILSGQAVNFNPATMLLSTAYVAFAFADTNEPNTRNNWNDEHDLNGLVEKVTIKLDTATFMSNVEVDGTHAAYDWTSADGNLTGSFLTSLQTDGKLNYVVTVTQGDVWFKGAKLTASGNYKVPDSTSTISALGLALAGLALVRRRR